LLPVVPRRADHPGRKRRADRKVLCGILFVLNVAGALDRSRFPAPDHTGRDGRGHRCSDDCGT
jgi:hypothetical protein